jgi:ABC-type iron transport system FetAB ATPase subunit
MLETQQLQRLHVGPIDLQVDAGTCVSIEGRSGSGKSVLLRMMADLDPHEGDVLLDNEACSRMPAPQWRRRVSYVAAAAGWWNDRVGPHFRDAAALGDLLPRVGLARDAGEWEVARLSTGERQRLALLRAMTPENRVLLLDEPTSGLDAESTWMVEVLLKERVAQGTTLLLVTHDPQQAVRLAQRRYQLVDGQLQECS